MVSAVTHELTPRERKAIRRLLKSIGDAPVLLMGSVARRTRTRPDGDIDLLVLYEGAWPAEARTSPLHVIALSYDELLGRLVDGDDFAHWALMFGKPLRRRRQWEMLRRELLQHASWPSTEAKRKLAATRLTIAAQLLAMGDMDAAQEELRFAAGHAARAVLLENGILPLSRPELAAQLEAIGRRRLADINVATSADARDKQSLERMLHEIHQALGAPGRGPE